MPPVQNKIRSRAIVLSTERAGVASERAEARSSRDTLFVICGIEWRRVTFFEKQVALVSYIS